MSAPIANQTRAHGGSEGLCRYPSLAIFAFMSPPDASCVVARGSPVFMARGLYCANRNRVLKSKMANVPNIPFGISTSKISSFPSNYQKDWRFFQTCQNIPFSTCNSCVFGLSLFRNQERMFDFWIQYSNTLCNVEDGKEL